MDAIVAYDLTKQFDTVTAVSKLNFRIKQGQSFACVGNEKSGKTTLVRLLSGLMRPTFGESIVMGFSPTVEVSRLHSAVGTVIDTAKMYGSLTLDENLRFFAGINGVDENDAIERISFLLHRLDIWESRDIKAADLPTSVRRRGNLARALVHRPGLLIADETSDSIDKETAESVHSLLTHLKEQEGLTLMLCTQNMEYAQALCDEFALLNSGVIMARGSFDALRKASGVSYLAQLKLGENDTPPRGCVFENGYWQKPVPTEQALADLIAGAVNHGRTLFEAQLKQPTLKEIYTAFLNGDNRKAGEENEHEREYEDEWDEPQQTAEPPEEYEQPEPTEQEQDDTDEPQFGPLDPEILKLLQADEDRADRE